MKQKENGPSQSNSIPASPQKNSNKTLFWILGGCLALFIITILVVGGLVFWGYKKINRAADYNKRQIEERQNEMNKPKESPQSISEPAPKVISEEPQINSGGAQSAEGAQPFAGERQIGYIKKVYAKNGVDYIDIDYIQWLTGTEAEKAMREDGECPKTGECVVLDDYYIRNVNSLIRTFEIAADAEITMQTYSMEKTGKIQPEKISFDQLSRLFAPSADPRFKDVPYIVEISSNKITKINEQYIP
ncbi:MAG: hypothetical protein WC831_01890 [Parcubacteria group bacterium]|jgi:hypothetical protein